MPRPHVDYHDFTTIDTTAAERKRLNVGDIWINAARCHECGEEVRSRNLHDFRSCKCGNVAVDGGSFYARRSFFKKIGGYDDIIVSFNDAPEIDVP